MSWQRRERASKTKAAENISTMIAEQPLVPADSSSEAGISASSDSSSSSKLCLKFTKQIWNSYTPSPPSSPPESTTASSSPTSKAGQKPKRKPSPVKSEDQPAAKAPKRSPPVRRQCKVKLTRFHYGGPDRREGGKYRDMITLESPCLQSTCTNCWTWHAHLMRGSVASDEMTETPDRPDKSPSGPSTDPMISNGKWQTRQSRRDSTNTTPKFTVPPAVVGQEMQPTFDQAMHSLNPQSRNPALSTRALPSAKYTILLPTSVLRHTASTPASARTGWRETRRQRHTARLRFTSDEGKTRFKKLAHKQLGREIQAERVKLRRVAKEAVRQAQLEGQGDVGRKPRGRHRLKLTFRSKMGKEKYGKLVERYLQ